MFGHLFTLLFIIEPNQLGVIVITITNIWSLRSVSAKLQITRAIIQEKCLTLYFQFGLVLVVCRNNAFQCDNIKLFSG